LLPVFLPFLLTANTKIMSGVQFAQGLQMSKLEISMEVQNFGTN
jgi:hypothetical protein